MLFWEKKEGVERGRGPLGGGMKGKDGWWQLCPDMGRQRKLIVICTRSNSDLKANHYLFEVQTNSGSHPKPIVV